VQVLFLSNTFMISTASSVCCTLRNKKAVLNYQTNKEASIFPNMNPELVSKIRMMIT
jgi:hypothetical protein